MHFNQSHPVRFENDTKIQQQTQTSMMTTTATAATTTTNLSSFSTSESHLCDQLGIVHDINCAKNKNSYLNQVQHNGQPDI